MSPLVVDTDVLIDYLRNHHKAIQFVEKHLNVIHVSVITVAELHAGARKNELMVLDNFLALFPMVAVNAEVATLAGSLRNAYGKSHGTGLADALIAASAHLKQAKLVTLNKKHYPMMQNVIVPYTRNG